MIRCTSCDSAMVARRMECGSCGISMGGEFGTPRLARLEAEDQQLLELFLLAGGSLKALAEELSLSYPTVRKRIDALIERLQALRDSDDAQNIAWLTSVESGSMAPEKAARLIRESAHG